MQNDDLTNIGTAIGRPYPFEQLDANQLSDLMPEVGETVVGATFSSMDGHVSPLRLLCAFVQAFTRAGGYIRTGEGVEAIEYCAGQFYLRTSRARSVEELRTNTEAAKTFFADRKKLNEETDRRRRELLERTAAFKQA